MSDAEDELERLQNRRRTNTESADEAAGDEHDPKPLDEAVAEAFDDLEDGDLHPNLSFRDERLSALFAALEATGQIDEIVENAAAELDADDVGDGQSEAMRLLLRVGLEETADGVLDAGRSGYQQHLTDRANEF